jgi:hypothetical protein
VKERDFRRSERWSILPAYTKDGYITYLPDSSGGDNDDSEHCQAHEKWSKMDVR